jgi:hypothetical protein
MRENWNVGLENPEAVPMTVVDESMPEDLGVEPSTEGTIAMDPLVNTGNWAAEGAEAP